MEPEGNISSHDSGCVAYAWSLHRDDEPAGHQML